jgi:signal recognition particle GTPase
VFLREVVIVDPASRLHTQANLMKELAKARRMVAGKLGTATRRCS